MIGQSQGLTDAGLIDGDATKLQFSSGQFDLVCAFGVLHHVPRPEHAVADMLRVANKAIFIFDSNNFGQGSLISNTIKQLFIFLGLWKMADRIKTRGKGHTIFEGDGLAYSYSVFNNYKQIEAQCGSIHPLNARKGRINPCATASHVALLGVKKQQESNEAHDRRARHSRDSIA